MIAHLSASLTSTLSKGGTRDIHRRDIMAEAGEIGDLDIRILLEHVDGREIDAVDIVDFAGIERVGARRDIDDGQHFDVIEIGLPSILK